MAPVTASPSAAVFSAETMKTYTICCRYGGGNCRILGWPQNKIAATLKVHKCHAQNVLVNHLYEALSSAFHGCRATSLQLVIPHLACHSLLSNLLEYKIPKTNHICHPQ